jgi:hypothetical protein
MRAPFCRNGLIVASVLGVAAGFAIIPAAQAGSAQAKWRITKIMRHCGAGDNLYSLTATGPRDAWALGQPYIGGPRCFADVEHWNGVRWRRIAVPAGPDLGPVGGPIAGSSRTDAWIFPARIGQIGLSSFVYNYALHWNGRSWTKSRFPVWMQVGTPIAFSPTDAWVFGSYYRTVNVTAEYTARFDGHRWRHVTLPASPASVSAVSHNDMWALGPTRHTAHRPPSRQSLRAMHWTGRSWRAQSVPRVTVPGPNSRFEFEQIAATGPRSLWWAYLTSNSNKSAAGLARLQGRQWSKIKVPAAITFLDAIAQDGHGGVWLLADVEVNFDSRQYWYHYRHGQWTRQPVATPRGYNTEMFAMALIPGTRSIWAVGEADGNTGFKTEGVIARYDRAGT